jgi:hypothetical protein
MKAILVLALSFFSISAFADQISCANEAHMVTLWVDSSAQQILGAAYYSHGQEASSYYSDVVAVGSVNPAAGYQVVLANKLTLDIDYSVVDGQKGTVTVDGSEVLHCN